MDAILRMTPVILFFVFLLGVGFYVQKKSSDAKAKDFSKEYFIGGRSLGGFVLAMTLVATYSSVSSFVGGVGMAWERGYGWVYYASVQVVAAFLVLGVLGKKMAVIGRKIDAVTVMDMLRARYKSDVVANIGALVLVVFFTTQILAQFIGGAQLFSASMGISYEVGLFLFALVVVIYTAVGGFNAVALTDTASAIVMVIGIGILAAAVIISGGGMSNIAANIATSSAESVATGEGINLLDPRASGLIPFQLFLSQWLLCGFTTVGLPQSQVRCLSYKDSKSVHRAMIYGTVVVGFMMIFVHLIGTLSVGTITGIEGSTDTLLPTLVANHLSPFLGGVVIIGPLAATMSTVSSLLIAGSSAIIKDLYIHYKEQKNSNIDQKFVSRISIATTTIMGIVAIVLALNPPDLIVWINMFAFGGLQTTFFLTMVFGLFWKKANATGAILSVVGGLAAYIVTMALGISIGSFHNIVIGIGVSLILFIIGNYLGKPIDEKTERLFFPEKCGRTA